MITANERFINKDQFHRKLNRIRGGVKDSNKYYNAISNISNKHALKIALTVGARTELRVLASMIECFLSVSDSFSNFKSLAFSIA